jgi:hypothetical protein
LVAVGRTDENDGAISRDIEGTSGANFSEENLDNDFPEEDCTLVGERGLSFFY